MKQLITALLVLAGYLASAQIVNSHSLSFGVGHEWNAFLSPSTFQEDRFVFSADQLWDNGTFQSISLKNAFKVEGENYKLKLKANGSLGVYQTIQNSNRYTYRLGASYRLKYAPKKYFELAPEIYRKRRDGVNADNAVLATPFSYTLVKAPLNMDFYLGNKSWLKTQVGYLFKNFDKSDGEKLMYKAPYLSVLISRKWELSTVTNKLSLKSTTQLRNYEVISRIEDEEEEEVLFREGSRNWTYQISQVMFDISKNDGFQKWNLGLYHTSRFDRNNNSTYHEVGPGIQFQTRASKILYKSSLRYSVRNYEKLSPGRGNDVPLQYQYIRGSMELGIFLSEKSLIYGKGSIVNRTSNNPDIASRSFRDYFNGYVEFGVRLNW